jgi:hypothetical protein
MHKRTASSVTEYTFQTSLPFVLLRVPHCYNLREIGNVRMLRFNSLLLQRLWQRSLGFDSRTLLLRRVIKRA